MRKRPQWEDDLRRVYRREIRKRTSSRAPDGWHIAVSDEFGMEIQESKNWGVHINIGKQLTTWQGIPLVVDHDLPPGCFVFREGERNERRMEMP